MEILDTISAVLTHKSHDLWTIKPTATVLEAIELMAEKHIASLLVMKGQSLVGIMTEREYMRDVFLKGKSSTTALVKEVMRKDPACISPHEAAVDGLKLMTELRVRHLPVVEDGQVVGLISIGDLVKWIINAQDMIIHQLEDYVQGGGGYPG